MGSSRRNLFRSPQCFALLIFTNIATFSYWIYVRWLPCNSLPSVIDIEKSHNDWQQQELLVSNPTITVTEAKTVTKVKEVVSIQTVTSTVPGPPFCDICGPEDKFCKQYGAHNLALSRVYEGSNARFRRVISSAMAGKPTKIGVIGGSISVGHALTNRNDKWPVRFSESWKKLFPKSETTLVNGAVPATGSSYMSMCFGEHIDNDVDLVIIELAINDQRQEPNAVAFEWLVRAILDLPKQPAVLNLQTIALGFDMITTGGDLHSPIASYYDIPIISLRNMLIRHIFKHSELDEYYFGRLMDPTKPDWNHVNILGHEMFDHLLTAYTQRQICAIEMDKTEPQPWTDPTNGKLPTTDGLEDIPRVRLFQKYDRTTVLDAVTPFCRSIQAPKHPLVPVEAYKWDTWTSPLSPDKQYLRATEIGALIRMEVEVGVMRRVRLTLLKSKSFGLGDVWCWVDDDRKSGKRLQGWWDNPTNVALAEDVTNNAEPGKHILSCEIIKETSDPGGGHEFRIIGVDAS